MSTKAITIHVSPQAARIYEKAEPGDRRKLDALLSLRLQEQPRRHRSLEEIMDEISDTAQSRGMTPEILDEILSE